MAPFRAVEPIRLMVSSRCKDPVPFDGSSQPMSVVRRRIKEILEQMRAGDHPLFEVWIHEDEAVTPGDQDSWTTCMRKVRAADVVLVLYNGRAGWPGTLAATGEEVGICHAEFATAYAQNPSKLRSVQVPLATTKLSTADRRFQLEFTKANILGGQAANGEEAVDLAIDAAVAALLDLARAGGQAGSRGGYYAGEALAWSRMDYETRRATTRGVIREVLTSGSASTGNGTVVVEVAGAKIAFRCDCIPAAMGTAAARELVGQPSSTITKSSPRFPQTSMVPST